MAKRTIDITYDAQTANYKRKVNDAEKFTKSATARMQGSANLLKTASTRLTASMRGITAGGFALTAMISKGVDSFLKLDKGMRNVNTIIKVSEKQLSSYTKEIVSLQRELGVSSEDLTNGFYQAVSAGIKASDAIDFLRVASQSSIAGISSVEVAVDGLTNVLNAFHLETNQTLKVADVMFQTVKLGKTNFDQLAVSISEFAPLAYSLGLTFEETAGALATITKQGVSTSQAATQLNAVFTGVLKGQERAQSMGASVAEAFSIQALQAKGLQKFLVDLEIALNGDQEAMVKLFGRAEAVKGILQLTGANARIASNDINSMKNSVNAMFEAFAEQEKSKTRMIEKFFERINTAVENTINSLTPAVNELKNIFSDIESIIIQHDKFVQKFSDSIDYKFLEAFDLSLNPSKNLLKGSKNLVGGNGLTKEEKDNIENKRQFIPGVGWITVKKDIKETREETEKLEKVFSMYNSTQEEINNRISELRDIRKDLVLWSDAYILNLREEEKLKKYLTTQPIKYTPIGEIKNKNLMISDFNNNDKLIGEKTYRHETKSSIDPFGEQWINDSLANEQRLFDDMMFNASQLGYALENAFSGHGNTLLAQLNQALQIAINISNALNKNDGSVGGILGVAASFVPGIGFLSNLFGGGKATGGNVNSGMFYKVNENGTELLSIGNSDYLMMGNNSGTITPNERINISNSGSVGNDSKLLSEIIGRLELNNLLTEQLSEAYYKGINSTELKGSLQGRDIYMSNKKQDQYIKGIIDKKIKSKYKLKLKLCTEN